ncbi:unnamed protein product [Prunus brigantina]
MLFLRDEMARRKIPASRKSLMSARDCATEKFGFCDGLLRDEIISSSHKVLLLHIRILPLQRENAKKKHSASASLSTSLPLLGLQYINWVSIVEISVSSRYVLRVVRRRCNNTLWETIENVGFHLVRNGMIETYSIWNLHGEQLEHASSSNATRVDNVQPIVDANDQVMDIIQDVFPFALTNMNQEEQDANRQCGV